MKRILVHIPMVTNGEYDIFRKTNIAEFGKIVAEQYNGVCPNIGNRLWFQGIISEISTPDNQLTFYSPNMTKDYINSQFDLVIAPMANVFSLGFQSLLETLADRFQGITIPIYVIACGVQADSYDQLETLCSILKPSASRFISNVYNSGGEFALRGYFTKEFFDKLGFSSAVVTGCPSLFQLGRNLCVPERKIPESEFRPILNGRPSHYKDILSKYENAEFFDQDSFFHDLWTANPAGCTMDWKVFIKKYGFDTTSWLLKDKIKLILDMNTWRQYLIKNRFSMSYGSRIHGSIMPILAGIPAVLECRDARTRELAEFFSIPCVAQDAYKSYNTLYELYCTVDYGVFNRRFGSLFGAYESFLQKCGIVERINENNIFFGDMQSIPEQSGNLEERTLLLEKLNQNQVYWKCYDKLLRMKRKMFSSV